VNVSSELQKWRQASRDLAAKLGYTWLPPGLGKQKVLLHRCFCRMLSWLQNLQSPPISDFTGATSESGCERECINNNNK